MDRFVAGDVVVVNFPFSNLKGQKLRPAIVLAIVEFDNLILCQVTSKPYASTSAIQITEADFVVGGLPIVSYIRPDKLFTSDPSIISKSIGKLSAKVRKQVLKRVQDIFTSR